MNAETQMSSMATTIPQTTLSMTMTMSMSTNSTPSSMVTSQLTHSNAIKRPSKVTSSVQSYVNNSKSSVHAPYVKSAIVFAFSLNDIIKSHLPEKKFRSDKEKVEVHFAQKLIGKIQLNFSELVLTLIYCNRYLRYCRRYNLPMPGSPGSVFPSMTHMVIPCLLLAEVYLIDCPHNSRWWANKCSGGVTVQNINCWKRDVLVTMKYWLYVEPTKHFVNWTRQVKKLAFNLFGQNAWQYHMGTLNSTSTKMVTKKPLSPKTTKPNDRPVAMEIMPNTDTTDLKESKEIVASKKIISNTKSSTLETIAEITNSKAIPNNNNTTNNINNTIKTSPSKISKSPISKSPKGTKIKTNTTQKAISRTNSSSFHRSLHNHLNANSGLYKNNNSNYFSIQNLLSSNFPFNKPNSLSSNSVLATASATSLLNVINNNASCKMASPTGGTSFKLLGLRDSSNYGASSSGTSQSRQRKRPVSMPVQSSVNGRMSITNMLNNTTSTSANGSSNQLAQKPIIPTRRNSYSLYQSPAAMYSSMDNNTPSSSSILANIGRSHTIKFTSSRFSGSFDHMANNHSTLSSNLDLIRESSEEHKEGKPDKRTYSNDSDKTRCNPQDSIVQVQSQSVNSGYLANTSLLSDLTHVPTTTSSVSNNINIIKDVNIFSSPSVRAPNTTTTTTTTSSSSYISNNDNDSAYQHLKSYLKATSDLSYSGCNGQKIENSLLSNLGLPSRQDSRMSSNFSFLGKFQSQSQHQQSQNQTSTSLNVQQYPQQNQQQQSSFYFPNTQKPPPQPITNSSAMHNPPVTQASTNGNAGSHTDLPPFLETINQAPTQFHYPFQSSRSSKNKNVNQGQMQIPPQFQNPNSLINNSNQGQNQNQDINYQNSYEVPTPGRSNSDSSNVPSIYSSTNITPFSPKSFTSSELNSTLSTTSVTRNSSLNTTITTSSYESNPSVKVNNDNFSNDVSMPSYMDYKKMAYLPSNFNPHCTQNIEEPSSLDNSNYVEQNNTIFKDPFFKSLVKNELENSSSQVSHESFRSDSMEIDEEKKILSPPTTPN